MHDTKYHRLVRSTNTLYMCTCTCIKQGQIQDFLGGGSLLGCACVQILDHTHFRKIMPTNGQ